VVQASEPFLGGFIAGAAFQIMASQLPAFFGLKFPDIDGQPAALFRKLYYLFTHTSLIRWSEVLVAMSCLLLMYVVKACSARYRECLNHVPLPDALIALIASTLVCWKFELHSTYDVSVIGHVPHGLPAFQDVSFDWPSWASPSLSTPTAFWLAMCSRALVLAILCSMMSLSVAVKFAKQFNYEKQVWQYHQYCFFFLFSYLIVDQ
jgi:MFS superfamily sulfate permease-like transporter